jgi:hypothetical protein
VEEFWFNRYGLCFSLLSSPSPKTVQTFEPSISMRSRWHAGRSGASYLLRGGTLVPKTCDKRRKKKCPTALLRG